MTGRRPGANLVLAAALLLFACAQMSASDPPRQLAGTRWLARTIDGGGVVAGAEPTLEFAGADRVAGSAGCNRYAGAALVSGNAVRVGPLASTRMACVPERMAQEDRFLAALGAAAAIRVEPPDTLVLVDGAGVERLRFSRLERPEAGSP